MNNMAYIRPITAISLFVPVLVAGVVGYTHKGEIRLRMINYLTSFDNAPDTVVAEGWADNNPPGCWAVARNLSQEQPLTPEQRESVENLESLSYLSGYQNAPYQSAVTCHDTDRACPGYNILISGHAPGITMIDMEGNPVHEWYNPEITLYGLWPEAQDRFISLDFWRRAHLFENGDMIVLIDGGGIVKIDKDSNIIWISES